MRWGATKWVNLNLFLRKVNQKSPFIVSTLNQFFSVTDAQSEVYSGASTCSEVSVCFSFSKAEIRLSSELWRSFIWKNKESSFIKWSSTRFVKITMSLFKQNLTHSFPMQENVVKRWLPICVDHYKCETYLLWIYFYKLLSKHFKNINIRK